jgi:hypothetical protein
MDLSRGLGDVYKRQGKKCPRYEKIGGRFNTVY